jgi:hypothetical protein
VAITQEDIDRLKTANAGRRLKQLTIRIDDGSEFECEVVVREPSRDEWRRFNDMANDDDKAAQLNEQMVAKLVVWPDGPGLGQLLDARPGLATKIAQEIMTIAGTGRAVTIEKKAL